MPPSIHDLQFERELRRFAAATRGLIVPQPCHIYSELEQFVRSDPVLAAREPAGGCYPVAAGRHNSKGA